MKGLIVVVEDDADTLFLLDEILSSVGYQTVGVRTADDVLSAVDGARPDLFVIDIMLRDKSGIEVADKLWLNGFGDVPMIAISASTVMREIARHTPLFQDVINKPFDMDALVERVEELVAARRLLGAAPVSGATSPVLVAS